MAFVQPSPSTSLRLSTFTQPAVDCTRPCQQHTLATVRMASSSEEGESKEPRVVGIAGNSLWKENLFAGGFPGGEAFYKQWIADGMTGDVPDTPTFMQPSAEFKPEKPKPKGGVLGILDRTEFFKDFEGQSEEVVEDESTDDSSSSSSSSTPFGMVEDQEIIPSDILNTEIPDDSLYSKYFPADKRSLAPHFTFDYNRKSKDRQYDRVGLSMLPVAASPSDVYYPTERKNKAPFIDISYTGSLTTASIKISLDEVSGLPTLPPPPKAGDTVVSLRPGNGGGLKLDFQNVQGEKLIL